MVAGGTVTWYFDAFDMALTIEVYEAKPGERLVFGGQRPGGPPALQEVILERDGGATVLRLVNSGFMEGDEWDEEFEGIDSGWTMALAQLRRWLEHYPDARGSAHVTVMRPATFDYDTLQSRYRTAVGLGEWLGNDVVCTPEPLGEEARLRLRIDGALPLEGDVLASSSRELLVSWPEQRGVLCLKAFSAGPDTRMVALDFRAWDRPNGEVAEVREHLQRALDRLVTRVLVRDA
jgi:hypothetical protein